MTVVPIEVKSGRDYTIHTALDRFVRNPDYPLRTGNVFSNERELRIEGKLVYAPIYMVMFLEAHETQPEALPRITLDDCIDIEP